MRKITWFLVLCISALSSQRVIAQDSIENQRNTVLIENMSEDSIKYRLELLRLSFLEGNQDQTFTNPQNRSQLIIPAHQLGLFCIFEKRLRNKTKLPLDFGTD